MKKYKAVHVDPKTFEQKEIETLIPLKIVKNVQQSLEQLGEEFIVTPVLINPENLSVKFGIIEDASVKYVISIHSRK